MCEFGTLTEAHVAVTGEMNNLSGQRPVETLLPRIVRSESLALCSLPRVSSAFSRMFENIPIRFSARSRGRSSHSPSPFKQVCVSQSKFPIQLRIPALWILQNSEFEEAFNSVFDLTFTLSLDHQHSKKEFCELIDSHSQNAHNSKLRVHCSLDNKAVR